VKLELPASVGIGAGVALVAVLAVGGALFLLYRNRERFDPTSDKNLAYSGAGAVVAALTGGAAAGGEDSLGGLAARVREWWSGDDAAIAALLQGSPQYGGVRPYAINPRERT